MNKPRAASAVLLVVAMLRGQLGAQSPTFTVTPSTDATALAQSIVGAGVTLVGTPRLTGMPEQSGLFNAFTTGTYTNPVTNTTGTVSIPRGVILSSGRVQDATGNYNFGADTDLAGPGDTALTAVSGFPTNDAVSLEFSFIPDGNEIFIEYLFASTEYPEFVNSSFNDVFGFFVNGVNVAVVPGTTDPVTINKINAGDTAGGSVSNPQYFTQYSTPNTPFNYGGATVLLTARATVNKGVVNTFRFAIADSSDAALDSAVLIGTGKFTTAPPANAPAITTSSLPDAQLQTPYSQQLAATGGAVPYRWGLSSGSLPPGLTMSSAGVITGTPTQAGTFNFTARVTDNNDIDTTRALSITVVSSGLTITTETLPSGQALIAYSTQFVATGGSPPYSWALASGSLPNGFSLNSSGVLSGTAGDAHSSTFQVRVTDGKNRSVTKSFALVIGPHEQVIRRLEIGTASLPDGIVGKLYAVTFVARNGSSPYAWSFSGLPPGVQSNSAGEIIGTPTRAGTFRVQAEVSDETGTRATGTFDLVVRVPPVAILTEKAPNGRVNDPYSASFVASGGAPPYTFTTSGGSLPPGVALGANGVVSGTPTQAGTFQFAIQATDSAGEKSTKSFTVVIGPPTLVITTLSLGNATLGRAFSLTLSAAGGTRPYNWSATGLPDGLAVNAETGVISGTATKTGTFPVSVRVTDKDNESVVKTYSVNVTTEVVITSTLGSMAAGVPASITLAATGGRPPYNWTVVSGSLPAGLNLSSGGLLTGTPTSAGDSNFVVQAQDADNVTGTKTFAMRVIAQLVITTESTPSAPFGSPYSLGLAAAGGTPPYTWSVSRGDLPPGLSLSASGAITGSPNAAGTFTFGAQVTDSATPPQTAQRAFTIQVLLPDVSGVSITVPANPQAGQQLRVGLGIASAYPVEVSGTLALTFAPNASNNADDPAIQFSTGGRSVSFTIPAGQTQAVFRAADLGVQTGTTAGTIALSPTLSASGAPVNCNCQLTQTIVIPRSAPVLSAVRVTRTAGGFSVLITGFSTSREVTQGVFRFAGGTALQTTELTVPLTNTFNAYYQGSTSAQFGGQFSLTIPFTIQGNTTTVNSLTVTLTNGTGTSQAVTASF